MACSKNTFLTSSMLYPVVQCLLHLFSCALRCTCLTLFYVGQSHRAGYPKQGDLQRSTCVHFQQMGLNAGLMASGKSAFSVAQGCSASNTGVPACTVFTCTSSPKPTCIERRQTGQTAHAAVCRLWAWGHQVGDAAAAATAAATEEALLVGQVLTHRWRVLLPWLHRHCITRTSVWSISPLNHTTRTISRGRCRVRESWEHGPCVVDRTVDRCQRHWHLHAAGV